MPAGGFGTSRDFKGNTKLNSKPTKSRGRKKMAANAKVRRRRRNRPKKDLSILPCSTARNAFDLLEDVKQVIREDPKRYNQEQWVTTTRPREKFGKHEDITHLGHRTDGLIDYTLEYLKEEDRLPKCGTIGCVAGWVYTMKATVDEKKSPAVFAGQILGLTLNQREELFSPDAAGCSPDDSTPEEHAEGGVEHITRFQEKYADQLKNTKV
jgi:hypothetical protein